MKSYRIVQTGPPHTGSTLLLNLVHGFICPNTEIHYNEHANDIDKFLVTKTHVLDINSITNRYPNHNLFFVISERNSNSLYEQYKNKDNILVINYNEINETKQLHLKDIIFNIYKKFMNFFPGELIPELDMDTIIDNMYTRINDMNNEYEKIKDKPFSYVNMFYGIHGSHRNRLN